MPAGFDRWRWPLLLVAAVLLLITLFGPTLNLTGQTFRYLFVIDITQSMNVADAGPGSADRRLAYARRAVIAAIERLPCGSEAGLALFTEHRTLPLITPVEVCDHYGELKAIVGGIDWQMAWADRSEVAKGLHTALQIGAQFGDDTRLVFVTDGHEAPPINPDYRPAFNKITVGEIKGLIAGIGGSTPAPIPRFDQYGEPDGVWAADQVLQVDTFSLGRSGTSVDETMAGIEGNDDLSDRIAAGTEHLSSLKEGYLKQLAVETALGYYRIDTADDFADRLIDPALGRSQKVLTDMRWLPGALALLLLLISLLPVRLTAR